MIPQEEVCLLLASDERTRTSLLHMH